MVSSKNNAAFWNGVGFKLADFDGASFIALNAASKGNQAFLHVHFGFGDDVLRT